MENILVRELFKNSEEYYTKEIKVSGWIRTVRDSKTFGFIELNDGSFFKNLQIVFDNTLLNFNEICKLTISSSVEITGIFTKTENAKQPFELKATSVKVVDLSDSDYPLQKKRHTVEYLRTIAHLRPRTNTFNAVFRARSVVSYAIHKFFQEKDLYVHIFQ